MCDTWQMIHDTWYMKWDIWNDICVTRVSSLSVLGSSFQLTGEEVSIPLLGLEKTSRPGAIRGEVRCPAGQHHPPLSVYLCLQDYLQRTVPLRDYYSHAENCVARQLFIATTKPFQPVKPTTLARWHLLAMGKAGLDTKSFKSHSARSASSSAMLRQGCSVAQILQGAHWSDTSRTFKLFYDRSWKS